MAMQPKRSENLTAAQYFRLNELKNIEVIDRKNKKNKDFILLDVGAGSGFLDRELENRGMKVISFDPNPRRPYYYRVVKALGHNLPLRNDQADAILCAHVLEHIPDRYVGLTLQEFKRVLKPSGKMIIMLPSSACMFLNIISQPLANIRRIVMAIMPKIAKSENDALGNNFLNAKRENLMIKGFKVVTIRWLLPAPHGVGMSAVHEFFTWRVRRWKDKLEKTDFIVSKIKKDGIARSQHHIFGILFWNLREYFGKVGFSGTNIFIVHNGR